MAIIRSIQGWGNAPSMEAAVHQTEFSEEVGKIVQLNNNVIPRGNGRSYGDAAINEIVYSTLKMDKILAFDEAAGLIECESGVLLSEILDFIIPKGYFLPVTPGTKFITLGGAIAADVHGKNHHLNGCFSNYLISFKIVTEEGATLYCSRNQNEELFWNTIGGMGRTGIILSASFQLKKITSSYIKFESIKANGLEELMQLFEASKNWTYTVAWMDCLQKGADKGRGVFLRGEHARKEDLPTKNMQSEPFRFESKPKWSVPFYFPSFVLNKSTVKLFNFFYYHKQRLKTKIGISNFNQFFYPLDKIKNWNRIYGKNGFTQYQFVIPKANAYRGLCEILEVLQNCNASSFLAVLKLFGKANPKAPWSFPMEGYTLAIDIKITPQIQQTIKALDSIVLKYGGKGYLAKDAFSCKALFNLPEEISQKFSSCQMRRLNDAVEFHQPKQATVRTLIPAISNG